MKISNRGNIFTSFLKFILIVIFVFACIGGLCAGVLSYMTFDLPDVKQLANYVPAVHSRILSRDGEILLSVGKEKREMVTLKEVPKVVIDAFLSSEDNKFYEHKGIDFLGIARALVADLKAGKIVQGGSTITQQVAKSLLLSKEKSFTRKFKDMLLAQQIEKTFTKDEILTLYLNHVYFGGGYYGIKAAFHGYFDKEIKDGTIAECAMLAGLLVAPGRYSPYINHHHAKMRQKYVIGRMYEDKRITKEQYEKALKEDLKIRIHANEELKAGHFTDWVRQRVIKLVGEDEFYTQGFKVVTTIDWELQKTAEEAVRVGVRELDKRQGFKGPIKSLTRDEDVKKFIIKSRRDFFEKNSMFFLIKPNGDKAYEIDFNENDYLKLVKEWEMSLAGKDSKHYFPGVGFYPDRVQNYLKQNEIYEGIVEKISDSQKLVFVSFLGTKGVIPQQYYRWAHKRKISENTTYVYNYVNNPSEILKKGDVIKVRLLDTKLKTLWENVADDYKKRFKGGGGAVVNDLKKERFYQLELDQDPEAEGALLALNANNGQILTMVGGIDFNKSQFNRVIQSSRQPGSSFKPIIYAAALENGYTPATIIMDSPEALTGQDDLSAWKPKNYDGEFEGPMTFRRALETSRNVPTIRIALDIGVKKIIEFAGRVGMDASAIDKDLSLALGSFGINLLNLVSAYAIFPNAGKRVIPKSIVSIVDRNGKSYYLDEISGFPGGVNVSTLPGGAPAAPAAAADAGTPASASASAPAPSENSFTNNFDKYRVYDSRLAYVMTNLLRGVIQAGTGASARDLGPRVGGKTGTTNDYVDAWFVGFSSNVVSGVWTGFDNNKTIGYGETGAKAALPVWKDFMKKVIQKYGDQDFQVPPGVVYSWINKETGNASQSDSANAYSESFVEGSEPGTFKNDLFKSPNAGSSGTGTGTGTGSGAGTGAGSGGKQIMDDDYYLHQ
ncbi:MAG: PBP1A family penicillin-binding protein [Oligoflexia bacterium]|nr:PBP1A family penicillin-binding protein [Oligoflexia bacterium]